MGFGRSGGIEEGRADLGAASRAPRHVDLIDRGAAGPKLARAQGFVDGYMRALLDAKLATQRELLAVVAEERSNINGPPSGVAESDEALAFTRAVA